MQYLFLNKVNFIISELILNRILFSHWTGFFSIIKHFEIQIKFLTCFPTGMCIKYNSTHQPRHPKNIPDTMPFPNIIRQFMMWCSTWVEKCHLELIQVSLYLWITLTGWFSFICNILHFLTFSSKISWVC